MISIFNSPAAVDLQDVHSVGELAVREGFTSVSEYSAQFADALCSSGSLDAMRERFTALASAAGSLDAERATAQEVTAMFVILESLFRKLIIQGTAATDSGVKGGSEAGERLLNGALKAQKSALACLSALKHLRDASPPAPTRPATLAPDSAAVIASSSPAALTLLANSK